VPKDGWDLLLELPSSSIVTALVDILEQDLSNSIAAARMSDGRVQTSVLHNIPHLANGLLTPVVGCMLPHLLCQNPDNLTPKLSAIVWKAWEKINKNPDLAWLLDTLSKVTLQHALPNLNSVPVPQVPAAFMHHFLDEPHKDLMPTSLAVAEEEIQMLCKAGREMHGEFVKSQNHIQHANAQLGLQDLALRQKSCQLYT
jgi:hypothetical protein